jgi:hypothetical protein
MLTLNASAVRSVIVFSSESSLCALFWRQFYPISHARVQFNLIGVAQLLIIFGHFQPLALLHLAQFEPLCLQRRKRCLLLRFELNPHGFGYLRLLNGFRRRCRGGSGRSFHAPSANAYRKSSQVKKESS